MGSPSLPPSPTPRPIELIFKVDHSIDDLQAADEIITICMRVCPTVFWNRPDLLRSTVEPRFHETLYDKVLDITKYTLQPGQSYSKMHGTRHGTEPRCNEILEIVHFEVSNVHKRAFY